MPPIGSQVIRPVCCRCTQSSSFRSIQLQQRGLDRVRVASHHALGGDLSRPGHPLEQAGGSHVDQAGPLLQQGLLEVTARYADLPPQRDQLVRGETVARVALGGLQLGRPLNDSLERGAVDASDGTLGSCYSCLGVRAAC